MKIYGLQKTTLLDFPGKVACTVFLGGCDFRCPFCHNYALAEGSSAPLMEEEDFFSFLKKRRGLLDGVAVTGGEPCLQRGLPAFLRQIKDLGFAVKLDTNGAHPGLLGEVLSAELADYVAMDLKNSPDKYPLTTGLPFLELAPVRESIALLMKGDTDYEFRTTVVEELHEASDFEAMGRWIAGARRYYLQPFSDRDSVPFGNLHAPSKEQLDTYLDIMSRYVKQCRIRGI